MSAARWWPQADYTMVHGWWKCYFRLLPLTSKIYGCSTGCSHLWIFVCHEMEAPSKVKTGLHSQSCTATSKVTASTMVVRTTLEEFKGCNFWQISWLLALSVVASWQKGQDIDYHQIKTWTKKTSKNQGAQFITWVHTKLLAKRKTDVDLRCILVKAHFAPSNRCHIDDKGELRTWASGVGISYLVDPRHFDSKRITVCIREASEDKPSEKYQSPDLPSKMSLSGNQKPSRIT